MTRAATNNHFITVSREGALMARRKGAAPVRVALAATGLRVETDAAARARGAAETVVVRFAPGGGNRQMLVTGVEHEGVVMDVDAFLARFEVSEIALGKWIRATVERALDAASNGM
ncbi:hypothetical protein [Polyangium aurulentum]|uniref:hypothetical protein n=1 Tax=Polyangium aurulentum TaxID=2567896 RepID=UPI0010AE038E|nr:hypothetical protein [Polyangium aurulentum]UQA56981.1 hypothetical protein E8A73_037670 [Polyangium aurulentum]